MLEAHLAQQPHHAAARVLLARAYAAEKRWDDAQQQWQRARLLAPGSPAVHEGQRQMFAARAAATTSAARPAARKSEADALAAPARASEILREIEARSGEASSEVPEGEAGRDRSRGVDVSAVDDLDRLIEELDAARMAPDPEIDDIPTPDLEDDLEEVVSETLARIYAAQSQHGEAARVYDKLAEQQPERAAEFQERAAEMRARADEEE